MLGLLKSARLALAPTLLTNALVAWCAVSLSVPSGQEWGAFLMIVLMGVCFFLVGMWQNDWFDSEWDKVNRPDKPLPQGKVSKKVLSTACALALYAGCFLLSRLVPLSSHSSWIAYSLGAELILVILFYNWIHKRTSASVIIMGLCRSSWVSLAGVCSFSSIHRDGDFFFSSSAWLLLLSYAVSLGVYTMIASVVARGESKSPVRRKWAGILLSSMTLHDMVWLIFITASWEMPLVAIGCYGASYLIKRSGQADT